MAADRLGIEYDYDRVLDRMLRKMPPLLHAIMNKQAGMVELLLQNGANVYEMGELRLWAASA